MRNLILHIGTRKTGTTSIQRSLAYSKEYLEKKNINYLGPNIGYRLYPLFINEPRKCYYFQIKNIDTKSKEIEELNRYKDKVVNKLNSIKDGIVIISEEDLLLISQNKISDLKDFLEKYFTTITIIVYLREPYSYFKGHLLQNVKAGTKSFEQIEPDQYHSFSQMIKSYLDCFINAKFIFRPFDKKSFINGDLIDDFIISSGLEDINIKKLYKIKANETLGKNSLLLLSETNKRYPLFVNGKRNPERGNGDYLRILEKIKDTKADFEIPISKDLICKMNNEIEFYNSLLPKDFYFEKIKYKGVKKVYPEDEFLPLDFVVDLVNEYNKKIDKLLGEIEKKK